MEKPNAIGVSAFLVKWTTNPVHGCLSAQLRPGPLPPGSLNSVTSTIDAWIVAIAQELAWRQNDQDESLDVQEGKPEADSRKPARVD